MPDIQRYTIRFENELDRVHEVEAWFSSFEEWCLSEHSQGSELWRSSDKIASARDSVSKRKIPPRPTRFVEAPFIPWNGWRSMYAELTLEEVDTFHCVLLYQDKPWREYLRQGGRDYYEPCELRSLRHQASRHLQEPTP
jgi:hypothetical protein